MLPNPDTLDAAGSQDLLHGGVPEKTDSLVTVELFRQDAREAEGGLSMDESDPGGDPRQPLDERDRSFASAADDHPFPAEGGGVPDQVVDSAVAPGELLFPKDTGLGGSASAGDDENPFV